MPSPNKVRAGHDGLWALVSSTFADAGDGLHHNPAGDKAPVAKVGGLAAYVAMIDDVAPEVLGVLCGGNDPVYDLRVEPEIHFAFSGKTKDERALAAIAQLERLKTAIKANRTLGGAVSFAEIGVADDLGVADSHWMAGGLLVRVPLLFTASTPAG